VASLFNIKVIIGVAQSHINAFFSNLITPKLAAELKLLFNKPAYGKHVGATKLSVIGLIQHILGTYA